MQNEHAGEYGHDGREIDEHRGARDGQHLECTVERNVGQHRGHHAQKQDRQHEGRVRHGLHDGTQIVPVLE